MSAKYSNIIAGVDFVPFFIETSGVWGEQAMSLVKELGQRMAEVNKDPRSTTFLRQPIWSMGLIYIGFGVFIWALSDR